MIGSPSDRWGQAMPAPILLASISIDQQIRWHTLRLLDDCLGAKPRSRCRQLVLQETNALRDLYDAVWRDLEMEFPSSLVRSLRHEIETATDSTANDIRRCQPTLDSRRAA